MKHTELTPRHFLLGLAALFLLSQILVHGVWARVGYRGAIEYHAGEAFEAHHASINLSRFGMQWAGLQDMATSPASAAHPYLYIHHPNFGLYFSHLLRLTGVERFETQMALSTLLWSTGVVVFALLVHALVGSRLLALATAALVVLDPGNALEYGCNIHRVNDFGAAALVLLAAWQFLRFGGKTRLLGLTLALAVAAGADYILFIFLTGLALLLALVNGTSLLVQTRALSWGRRTTAAILPILAIGAAAVAVFSARQVQVIAGAGLEVWKRDFLYQVLNRTHNEQLYRGQWSHETTAFYADQHILNPGFAPKNKVFTRFEVVGRTLSRKLSLFFVGNRPGWAATLGRQGPAIFLVLGIVTAGLVLGGLRRETGSAVTGVFARPVLTVGLAILVALSALCFLLPTYFTQWFPAFRLPLFVSALLAALALAPLRFLGHGRPLVWLVAAALALKLAGLPAALQTVRDTGLDHAAYCRSLAPGVTYSNFTSASLSSFTRQPTCVPTYDGFLKLAANGRVDSPADLFFLLERDGAQNPAYLAPAGVVLFKLMDHRVLDAMSRSPHFRRVAEGTSFIAYERIGP